MSLLTGAVAAAVVWGTAMFLLAFAATTLGRKLSSQTRHLIWVGVVAGFLLLPLSWLTLPLPRVGGRIRLEEVAVLTHLHVPPLLLLLVWLAGVLFLMGRLLVGGKKLRRLRREATNDSRLRCLAKELAGEGVALGKLEVARSERCGVPFTCGLLRPVIVLPQDAAAWSPGRLGSVLAHELAHIRRRDVLIQSLAYGVCLLFWFIPPLWLAYAALLREAETCCDQQVIDRGFRGSQYARDLLDLARGSAGRILLPAISSEAGMPASLKVRIRNLMSLKPRRQPFGIRGEGRKQLARGKLPRARRRNAMKLAKALLLGGATLLAVLLAFGCSLLPREDTGAVAGWYLKLQIQTPGSKGITVTDFNVTGLNIQVLDPAGGVLRSIDWAAAEGSQSYLIPVKQVGEHHIAVTHFGERNGESVQVSESAAFSLQAMKITIIDIVPGCIGMMRVAEGEPPAQIDLTGYWDQNVTFADGTVMGDQLWYMQQTGTTVDCPMGMSFELDGHALSGEAWIPDFGCYVTITGTVSADGSEIAGTMSGFPFGGGSATFRMVRSTMTFGRLDLEGSCGGVPIALHTDFGYGSGGQVKSMYTHSFGFDLGTSWGNLRLVGAGPLSTGSYPVTGDWPEEPGQIQAVLWDGAGEQYAFGGTVQITAYDSMGMEGSFDLSFPSGNLLGDFHLEFGVSSGQVTVDGTWNGMPLPGTLQNVSSELSVWTTTHFELAYIDHQLQVILFCGVNGEWHTGQYSSQDAWIDLDWRPESAPEIMDYSAQDQENYLNLTRCGADGAAGTFRMSFQQGGVVSGSFEVSFRQ